MTNNLPNTIYLSVVACGDREEDVMVLLKSAVLLTPGPLVFCIFSDDQLGSLFKQWVGCFIETITNTSQLMLYDYCHVGISILNVWNCVINGADVSFLCISLCCQFLHFGNHAYTHTLCTVLYKNDVCTINSKVGFSSDAVLLSKFFQNIARFLQSGGDFFVHDAK